MGEAVASSTPVGEAPISGVSGSRSCLKALAALGASLSDTWSPSEAADVVEQAALSALSATSAVVVTLGAFPPPAPGSAVAPDAATFHVIHSAGLSVKVSKVLEQQPLDAALAFADVARSGRPLFLASDADLRRYPNWGEAIISAGAHAAALVPVSASGELRGVLGLTWAQPREFDEDARAFVWTLGVMCANAMMCASLKGAERAAREAAEAAAIGAAERAAIAAAERVAERAAREAAERANEVKAQLIATITHELRTPISAILGYTEILSAEIDGPLTDVQQRHLGRMRVVGKHLLSLIDDLLSFARIEAGAQVIRPERVLLADVMAGSLALVHPLAELKGLHLRLEAPVESLALHTDPRKLHQILVNLLGNAVKYSATGEIVVRPHVEGSGADARVFVEVTDPGVGLSPEDKTHVFDPFWQKDPRPSSGSSGLGLPVARQLARLLGGDLTVGASAERHGSTFVLSFPAQYAPTSG